MTWCLNAHPGWYVHEPICIPTGCVLTDHGLLNYFSSVTGAFSRLLNDLGPHLQKEISRKQCVLDGGGCNFKVADNPGADGSEPWYEVGVLNSTDDYALTIELSAKAFR